MPSDLGLMLLFGAALGFVLGVIRFFAWLTDIQESGGFAAAIRRTWDRYVESRSNMSSRKVQWQHVDRPDPVYIPVSHTDMPSTDMDAPKADIGAKWPSMPRLSRDITDSDMVVFLAVVRNADGKYRYSANDIFSLVKGDRNTVLAKVREIRNVPQPAEFRTLDTHQQPVLKS